MKRSGCCCLCSCNDSCQVSNRTQQFGMIRRLHPPVNIVREATGNHTTVTNVNSFPFGGLWRTKLCQYRSTILYTPQNLMLFGEEILLFLRCLFVKLFAGASVGGSRIFCFTWPGVPEPLFYNTCFKNIIPNG